MGLKNPGAIQILSFYKQINPTGLIKTWSIQILSFYNQVNPTGLINPGAIGFLFVSTFFVNEIRHRRCFLFVVIRSKTETESHGDDLFVISTQTNTFHHIQPQTSAIN
jgi:hypothetical protein